MAMRANCTLDTYTLPPNFSYRPYMPRKRKSVTATAKAVITQSAETVIVHGDGTLGWSIEGAYPWEFEGLWTIFNENSLTLMTFSGYWGEVLSVYWDVFDSPNVRGRLFNLSGAFQVIDVTTGYANADCSLVAWPAAADLTPPSP